MGLLGNATHLVKLADGHLAKASVGCEFDLLAMADSYEIDGYVDGDLTNCTDCDNRSANVWQGKFIKRTTPCQWAVPPLQTEINGKWLWDQTNKTHLQWYNAPDCYWQLMIQCYKIIGGLGFIIWRGTKLIGFNPAGVYTRQEGCDAAANLTIIETP